MAITATNPATGQSIRTYEPMTASDAASAVARADRTAKEWRQASFSERAAVIRKTAAILRERKHQVAGLMAEEMGKPVKQGTAEAEKCAWVCDYYAEHAGSLLAPEAVQTQYVSYVAFEPLGVILAVMPWNFPFWQVFRFAAPALMAGNAALLKHSSNVPGCALAIEEILETAGLPQGAFTSVLIEGGQVKGLIENPAIKAVTLTGSTPSGRSVAAQAGAVLKKTVLELGGSDAYIVLEDANLENAVKNCVDSRLINSGQSCIAAKRFIAVEPIAQEFQELFVAQMREKKLGDPLREETEIGPLARRELRDDLHRQVRDSVERGAALLTGGTVPDGPGAYYPPTVLAGVNSGMAAYCEETFGPVAAIIPAKDEADAVRIANDSVFGLGAAVFTEDDARGERIAGELEAGAVFVNSFVVSDPRLPFGGVKESGYGRELGSYGIKEFVNIKTVCIKGRSQSGPKVQTE